MAAATANICAVCREVYRSPRFLPCYHTFCLACLEELANRHGDIIPCPTCRACATVPPGGVCDLQVNFYITEDLSQAAARHKTTINEDVRYLEDSIERMIENLKSLKHNEQLAQGERESVRENIQARYEVIIVLANKYHCKAMKNLEQIAEGLEIDLAADTQRVQDELNSLLQLQSRAQRAMSSACDTEVLEVEREMTRGEGIAERLSELESTLPRMTYRPGLSGDSSIDIGDYIKRFIGSPVILDFPTKDD